MARYATYGGAINAEGAFKPLQHLFRTGFSYGFSVTQRGAGANMSVDVTAGGASHVTSGSVGYYGWSDATENVTVSASNPSNPRKDILVSYIDLSLITTSSTNNVNALKFLVVAGTAAASPSDPSDPTIQSAVGAGNPFNKLARIDVAAAASSIVTANVTNLKVPMALAVPYLYGGASNTNGHLVPNVADDTVALLSATQTLTNKTIDGSQLVTNSVSGTKLTDATVTNAKLSTAAGEIGAAFGSYTPTITGYSANPTGGVYTYFKIGKLGIVTLRESGNGTSNATTSTYTLPVGWTAATRSGQVHSGSASVFDNGTQQTSPGLLTVSSAGTAITVTKNFAFAAFTSSGGKRVEYGTIILELA